MRGSLRRDVLLLGAVLVSGCTSSSALTPASPSPQPTPSASGSPGGILASASPAGGAAAPASPPAQTAVCRDPHEHVYSPDRLVLRNPCMAVTGRVMSILSEPDGDYHIRLKLDPQFSALINGGNVSGQHGDLVLEPVCEHAVTQRDAVATCVGVAPTVPLPAVGIHAVATGAYVLDTTHGWMELHPLWDIHGG